MDQSQYLASKQELQRRMSETRSSMAQTVGEIRHEFSDAFRWETYIQRYPGTCLLVAGGIGWALGNILAGQDHDIPSSGLNEVSQSTEPSEFKRMAERIASSIVTGGLSILTERMKRLFRGN